MQKYSGFPQYWITFHIWASKIQETIKWQLSEVFVTHGYHLVTQTKQPLLDNYGRPLLKYSGLWPNHCLVGVLHYLYTLLNV